MSPIFLLNALCAGALFRYMLDTRPSPYAGFLGLLAWANLAVCVLAALGVISA